MIDAPVSVEWMGRPQPSLVVMGASAGGVEALSTVVAGLPEDLDAAVLVVLHVASDGYSVLPDILRRAGSLPSRHAADGEAIEAGTLYVAPPDHHLLVVDGRLRLDAGPMENMARPSIDRLFTSAAETHGAGVIGVVLSGMLDDGTAGLIAVAQHGGVGVVQDPDDAVFPSMPRSAVRYADPRHVVPLHEVAPLLERIVGSSPRPPDIPTADSAARPTDQPSHADDATSVAVGASPDDLRASTDEPPSGLSCPACGGSLWEEPRGDLLTYRCRVGHGFSPESLSAAQVAGLEKALWTAITALEERAELAGRLAARASSREQTARARRYGTEADDARRRASLVRDVVQDLAGTPPLASGATEDGDAS